MGKKKVKYEWYLALGPHYWGRGNSADEAKKHLKKTCGARDYNKFVKEGVVALYATDGDKLYIDDMGMVYSEGGELLKLAWMEELPIWRAGEEE